VTSPSPLEATISTKLLARIIILLIAAWSLLAGVLLVFFHGTASGALGAGVADEAGQRLVGAHLLLLVPVYLLIAWHPERYQALFWLPFAAQLVVVLSVGYGILNGDTDFGDGMLAVAVGAIFAGLLGFIWISEQRSLARAKLEAEHGSVDWIDDQQTSGDEDLDSPF
jgi:hypothetical protein